ncbi:MAG: amino acid permease [Candidatus Omnitrophica bacterium]|nr:amino acid permease [Candidatus Omnitrophota bacterium]
MRSSPRSWLRQHGFWIFWNRRSVNKTPSSSTGESIRRLGARVTKDDLKIVLGRWDSVAIVIAIVIGVGIFRVPSEVATYIKSPWLIMVAWLAGGLISLVGALCYAELASTFPETGGNYVYLKKSYGPLTAFLFGWSELLVIRAGSLAAVAFIFAEYLASFLGADKLLVKPFAVFSIVLLGVVNIAGLRQSKRTQNFFVVVKLLALVALIFLGFISGEGDYGRFRMSFEGGGGDTLYFFGVALIPILWTYGGWHENVFVAGETINARTTLPFALVTGIVSVIVLYLGANALYLYLFPPEAIQRTDIVAAKVFTLLHTRYGRKIFESVVIVSSIATINSMIMTGSRITYAMARDLRYFRYFNRLSKRQATPYRAIIVLAVWSVLLVLWGTFNRLLYFAGFLVWIFFALVVAGLIILRYKYPDKKRPYAVWGYPFLPAAFMMVSFALAVVSFASHVQTSLAGLAILAAGLPLYYFSKRKE